MNSIVQNEIIKKHVKQNVFYVIKTFTTVAIFPKWYPLSIKIPLQYFASIAALKYLKNNDIIDNSVFRDKQLEQQSVTLSHRRI